MKHRDVYTYLDTVAPLAIQEDWDHAGFMLGSLDDETTGILVTLDFTRETLTAAIDIGANLIVTHHPVIFAPLASVDRETAKAISSRAHSSRASPSSRGTRILTKRQAV